MEPVIDLTSPEIKQEPEGAAGGIPILIGFHVPEGVDAAFLAALPREMREKVVADFLR